MLCKKCGAEITDKAKFCGYCGETVEAAPIVNEPQNVETNTNDVVNATVTSEIDLGKTVVVEPIAQNNVEQPMMNQPAPNNQNDKKGKLPVLVIVGIVLAVLATVLLVFALSNKSSNSIEVLKKSLANIEKEYDSATIEAKLSMEAAGTSLDLSAAIKTKKINDKKAKIQVTVNKSMLFDEMNVYAEIDEKEFKAYLESKLVDMMGTTSSVTPTWIKYTLPLDELMEGMDVEEKTNDLKLEDVIDEKHFVYVDKVDGLNHYNLIIDQELINKISDISGEKLEDAETLEKPIKVGFYITNSNEISKIELDMSDYLEENTISRFVLIFEIKDLNKTNVEIPSEALNTTTDLMTYMFENSVSSSDDYDYDIDIDTDFNTDFDFDYDTQLNY